jgi:hypothetical protein
MTNTAKIEIKLAVHILVNITAYIISNQNHKQGNEEI